MLKKVLTTKEIYSTLVIEGGLDPEYVLDKMQMYELEPLINIYIRRTGIAGNRLE